MSSKVLTERITISLAPEQKAAFRLARSKAGDDKSDNQLLHVLLADYCAVYGVDWPHVELPAEGRNWKRGKGGKFTGKP